MHNNKFFRCLLQFLKGITYILPALFWVLVIYGFDIPCVAGITILSALIHECGHIAYIFLMSREKIQLYTVLSGFRIKKTKSSSYLYDLHLYAFGPLANFIAAAVALLCFESFTYMKLFAYINIATALSNLLPVNGYDGYGIVYSCVHFYNKDSKLVPILNRISFAVIAVFTLLALYMLSRIGNGYWLAGLFIILLIKEVARSIQK